MDPAVQMRAGTGWGLRRRRRPRALFGEDERAGVRRARTGESKARCHAVEAPSPVMRSSPRFRAICAREVNRLPFDGVPSGESSKRKDAMPTTFSKLLSLLAIVAAPGLAKGEIEAQIAEARGLPRLRLVGEGRMQRQGRMQWLRLSVAPDGRSTLVETKNRTREREMKRIAIALLVCAAPAVSFASEPECITNYGETACGYDCVANYGMVKCAQTPAGACLANYGEVVCWDPPRQRRRGRQRQAECLANYGTIACGYDCVANYGEVKCAKTPHGKCEANYGEVVCWDP